MLTRKVSSLSPFICLVTVKSCVLCLVVYIVSVKSCSEVLGWGGGGGCWMYRAKRHISVTGQFSLQSVLALTIPKTALVFISIWPSPLPTCLPVADVCNLCGAIPAISPHHISDSQILHRFVQKDCFRLLDRPIGYLLSASVCMAVRCHPSKTALDCLTVPLITYWAPVSAWLCGAIPPRLL